MRRCLRGSKLTGRLMDSGTDDGDESFGGERDGGVREGHGDLAGAGRERFTIAIIVSFLY